VLRWTWRVSYFSYGALGTDRYPPITLDEAPDYPATLDVAYPDIPAVNGGRQGNGHRSWPAARQGTTR
jgi:hypothetical protein